MDAVFDSRFDMANNDMQSIHRLCQRMELTSYSTSFSGIDSPGTAFHTLRLAAGAMTGVDLGHPPHMYGVDPGTRMIHLLKVALGYTRSDNQTKEISSGLLLTCWLSTLHYRNISHITVISHQTNWYWYQQYSKSHCHTVICHNVGEKHTHRFCFHKFTRFSQSTQPTKPTSHEEWDNQAQNELKAHPCKPECLFGDITGFLLPSVANEVKSTSDLGAMVGKLKDLVTNNKALKATLKSWCVIHGKHCQVKQGANLHVAGTPCTADSSMGLQEGKDSLPFCFFLTWAAMRIVLGEPIIIQECVDAFDRASFTEFLGMYDWTFVVLSPAQFGWPIARNRQWAVFLDQFSIFILYVMIIYLFHLFSLWFFTLHSYKVYESTQ